MSFFKANNLCQFIKNGRHQKPLPFTPDGVPANATRINGNAIAAISSFCVWLAPLSSADKLWKATACIYHKWSCFFRYTHTISNSYMCTGLCEIRIQSVISFHSVVMKKVALVQDFIGTHRVSWENDTIYKNPDGTQGLPVIGLLGRLVVTVDKQND